MRRVLLYNHHNGSFPFYLSVLVCPESLFWLCLPSNIFSQGIILMTLLWNRYLIHAVLLQLNTIFFFENHCRHHSEQFSKNGYISNLSHGVTYLHQVKVRANAKWSNDKHQRNFRFRFRLWSAWMSVVALYSANNEYPERNLVKTIRTGVISDKWR